MKPIGFPPKQGLYDPSYEHDSCGVGFVADIKGCRSHDIVAKGIQVLNNLSHRGAQGADPKTGDGAGILIQLPHEFFKAELGLKGIKLPDAGLYAVGMVFLPSAQESHKFCLSTFEKISVAEGFEIIAWRDVPVASKNIGKTAQEV